ncbi:tetraprenyl-beta-curcumene synthase family protein [Pseudoclostridium thermosuccinogenes]|uniref:tetraprenyl-beta-curcumene synthase family protein n=1 Tax=Clostridium thermosuccinogenes TaxID=84032 RepID=UPI002FD9DFC2
MNLIKRFVGKAFPKVDGELEHWKEVCGKAEDDELKKQALASIEMKRFHALGGSVYALYPGTDLENTVKFITALQTISDYLDNLCDRAGVSDEAAFRQLHISMLDAVDPYRDKSDYYLYYPCKKDGGYLEALVDMCRIQVLTLPSHSIILEKMKKYICLYSEMQSLKHIKPDVREKRLSSWAEGLLKEYPGIYWWEFAAAAGSTLYVFLLYAIASDPHLSPDEIDLLEKAYFPWVCGLHILLDYYIDAREDIETGDLNFTSFYESPLQMEERLSLFIGECLELCSQLKYPKFHTTIIKGLLAMYLSDPKARTEGIRRTTRTLLKKGGYGAVLYHRICRMLRHAGKI